MGRLNEFGWGYPKDMKNLGTEPRIGAAVVTREGELGHMAYIEGIIGDTLYLAEGNYVPGKVTTRTISIHSPLIRGYFY